MHNDMSERRYDIVVLHIYADECIKKNNNYFDIKYFGLFQILPKTRISHMHKTIQFLEYISIKYLKF